MVCITKPELTECYTQLSDALTDGATDCTTQALTCMGGAEQQHNITLL